MNDVIFFNESKRELFRASHNYKKLARRLKASYNVQSNAEGLSAERLKGAHCIVFAASAEPLSPSEVAALQGYVDGGGSLVVLSGEGGPAAVNSNINEVVSKCVRLHLSLPWGSLPPPICAVGKSKQEGRKTWVFFSPRALPRTPTPPPPPPPLLAQVWHHH